MTNSKLPIAATSAYALAGAGWIIAGYFLSQALYGRHDASIFEMYNGLAFVAVTATVLYIVLRHLSASSSEAKAIPGEIAEQFRESVRSGERTLRRLPFQLAILVAALLCLLLLGLAWMRENALRAGEATAQAVQFTVAAQIGSSLRAVDITLADVARDLATAKATSSAADLSPHLHDVTVVARTLAVIDEHGRMIYNSDGRTSAGDFSGREYFRHHRDHLQSGFHISNPLRSVFTNTWLIAASHAVRGPAGEFRGVVIAVLDLERFGRYWQVPGFGENENITLFRNDGSLLLRSPHSEEAPGRLDKRVLKWLELLPTHPAGVYRTRSAIDGLDKIFAYGRVQEYPEFVAVFGIPYHQLLRQWQGFAAMSLGAFMIFAGVVTVFAFILLRQLRARLASQRSAAELARYPLQNRNPIMTVARDGAQLFMNPAARELMLSVHGTAAGRYLDDAIQSMAAESAAGTREFSVGPRVMTVSYVPHPAGHCDLYLTDITAARQDEELLRLFFDLPFIGMAITSPESKRWLRFNDQLCKILGYSREALQQKTWGELTHPDDLAAEIAEYERVMQDKSDGYTLDKRLIRPDGTTVHAALDVRAMRRPDRSIDYFVATVQDITERKQREHSLSQQRDLYAALSATNEAIVRLHERGALFNRICETAVEKAGFAFAWIGLLDPADHTIRPVARYGDDQGYIKNAHFSTDPSRPDGRGTTALSVNEGRHQIVNNITGTWYEPAVRAGVQSLATFPIRQGGAVIGALKLYARERDYFDADIVKLLDEMVADMSYALDNIENEKRRALAVANLKIAEERWQYALEGGEHGVWEWNTQSGEAFFSRHWKTMIGYADAEIGDQLDEWKSRVHPDDLASTLRELECHLRGESPAYISEHRMRCKDGSYIWTLDRGKVISRTLDGKPLTVIGTQTDMTGQREIQQRLQESEAKFKGLVEQSLVGIFILDDTTLYYANPRSAEIFGFAPDEILGPKLHKLIQPDDWPLVEGSIRKCLSGEIVELKTEFRSLRGDSETIHVGMHGSRSTYVNRPVVIGVLQDITERLRTQAQVADYTARLERAVMSTVGTISEIVELRDPYTAGHERRVAILAAALGAELGLSEHETNGLHIMGSVHDVGKITVPAEILSKPGKLTALELAMIKEHPQQGYEILRKIDFPWPVAQAVWQHHERMDGSGYPQGLKGADIMLQARILAVADVVESMASHRPYRSARGIDLALAEIEQNAGKLYDTDVVAACLRMFREKGYQLPA